MGQHRRGTGSTAPALPRTPRGGRHETPRVCHLLTHIQAGNRPAGTISVPLLRVCSPRTCLIIPSLPHSATSKEELRTSPSTNGHPKAGPGVPPTAPRVAGWAKQPRYERVKPLPPTQHPPLLPLPAPCQLPGVNTSWGGRGGVKLLSGIGVLPGGLPAPQHPALPDGGSHPPTTGSVLGGLGRLPAPQDCVCWCRLGAQPHLNMDPHGDF